MSRDKRPRAPLRADNFGEVCACCGQRLVPHLLKFRQAELTMTETMLCVKIYAMGDVGVTVSTLIDHLYGYDSEGGPITADQTVYQLICYSRKKLKKVGLRITCQQRGGRIPGIYRIEEDEKDEC